MQFNALGKKQDCVHKAEVAYVMEYFDGLVKRMDPKDKERNRQIKWGPSLKRYMLGIPKSGCEFWRHLNFDQHLRILRRPSVSPFHGHDLA